MRLVSTLFLVLVLSWLGGIAATQGAGGVQGVPPRLRGPNPMPVDVRIPSTHTANPPPGVPGGGG